jgi:alkanesulfonate monooxygenase SsuD/methylene tetrahydromethanopterin reductase-like flavin-dependent oxidoreductase (luciferase family)
MGIEQMRRRSGVACLDGGGGFALSLPVVQTGDLPGRRRMKFGLFISAQQPRSEDPVRRFRECVAQARLAKDVGFDALAAGHHYLSPPYQSLQSLPLLTRLASEAPGLELCLSIILLSMMNPVQVAEDVASLDIMSEGKVVFGIGQGYRDVEFEAFGVSPKVRVPRMLEGLELIKRLWTEDNVTFEGKFFQVHDATCTIRPVQKPYLPIWVAANADPAVLRTARMGLPWFINPHAALPTIERQWERFKQTLAEANQPMPAARPIALELSVAATREEAIETAKPFLEGKYNAYAEWGQDKVLPGQESFRVSFDDLARDRFVLGTPDEVIEQLEARVQRLETNYFIFRAGWPGIEAWKVLRVVEMMGQHVLPYFHKKYGRG